MLYEEFKGNGLSEKIYWEDEKDYIPKRKIDRGGIEECRTGSFQAYSRVGISEARGGYGRTSHSPNRRWINSNQYKANIQARLPFVQAACPFSKLSPSS